MRMLQLSCNILDARKEVAQKVGGSSKVFIIFNSARGNYKSLATATHRASCKDEVLRKL